MQVCKLQVSLVVKRNLYKITEIAICFEELISYQYLHVLPVYIYSLQHLLSFYLADPGPAFKFHSLPSQLSQILINTNQLINSHQFFKSKLQTKTLQIHPHQYLPIQTQFLPNSHTDSELTWYPTSSPPFPFT